MMDSEAGIRLSTHRALSMPRYVSVMAKELLSEP